MTGERAIRSIGVAGGGIVGLSAALAFARALPDATITLLETSPDPAALAEISPVALSSGARFHALIGIDEGDLVRAGIATHFLGTCFEDWSASGVPWWHVLGPYGKAAGAIPFDQIWAAAHADGRAFAYDRYAIAAGLARADKFVHPAGNPEFVGSRFAYGLRLDPQLYREQLRILAIEANIACQVGEIAGADLREDGAIAALRLADGGRIEADLFIDCTGPSAGVAAIIDDSLEPCAAWFPFDRMTIAAAPGNATPSPADRVAATATGWTARWPLRGRTMVARFDANVMDSDESAVTIACGRRLRPWVRNVLAIGDAAAAMPPLHRLNLDLAQGAILLALELLPGRDFSPLETGEYNRRAELVTRRVRDFLALHFVRSGRRDGVWRELPAGEFPDSLARTLDHYEHRGRLPFHEDESVSRDSWTAALLGLGVLPRHVDPAAAAVRIDQAVPAMDRLAQEIEDVVRPLPPYAAYLERMIAAPAR